MCLRVLRACLTRGCGQSQLLCPVLSRAFQGGSGFQTAWKIVLGDLWSQSESPLAGIGRLESAMQTVCVWHSGVSDSCAASEVVKHSLSILREKVTASARCSQYNRHFKVTSDNSCVHQQAQLVYCQKPLPGIHKLEDCYQTLRHSMPFFGDAFMD